MKMPRRKRATGRPGRPVGHGQAPSPRDNASFDQETLRVGEKAPAGSTFNGRLEEPEWNGRGRPAPQPPGQCMEARGLPQTISCFQPLPSGDGMKMQRKKRVTAPPARPVGHGQAPSPRDNASFDQETLRVGEKAPAGATFNGRLEEPGWNGRVWRGGRGRPAPQPPGQCMEARRLPQTTPCFQPLPSGDAVCLPPPPPVVLIVQPPFATLVRRAGVDPLRPDRPGPWTDRGRCRIAPRRRGGLHP